MAYKNATLIVENKDVIFIKPSKPTPTTILSLSTIDNAPDNNFFAQIILVYQSPNQNSPKLDPAKVIKEGLSKALFYYYPLAGKLVRHDSDGRLRINCTSEGVPFIEAICNCELSSLDYLDGNNVEMGKHFLIDFPFQDEFGNQYPIIFKLTKFLCGGFFLVVAMSHAVIDGIGCSKFLRAMAELASGKIEPSVKPVWERERLVGIITSQPMENPINKASLVAISPFLPTSDFVQECSRVDSESITRLKRSLMKESGNESEYITSQKKSRFNTFESLAAYIWRARARALKLSYDGVTMLTIVVGVKPRLLDPLPDGYYGNNILQAYVMSTVRELNERPLFEVVKLIRESIKVASSDDYIRNSINTMETKPIKLDNYERGAVMTLTDFRHVGLLEKVDFGWKEPVNTMPLSNDLYGFVGVCRILAPTKLDPSMSGGARIYICLPSAAMPKFKEEMEALTSLGQKKNSILLSKI